MVENINNEILASEQSQDKLKEIIKNSYEMYVNCIYNLAFLPLRIEALSKEILETDKEDEIKTRKTAIEWNEREIKANKEWMKQYEQVIPFLNTLITNK